MANLIGFQEGTSIVWADIGGDFGGSPKAGTKQITLATLAAGAARQGVKADMASIATSHIANRFAVTLRVEFDVAPADGKAVDLYWAASPSSVAGTANPGGTTGTDAAYTGTPGSTIAESVLQLQFIGSLPCTNDAATNVLQKTFITSLPLRYGMPVLVNSADQAFEGDDVEMSIIFTPLEDEAQ